MAATQDYTKMMKDFMGNFPGMDMSAMQEAYKSYAALGEKFSKVALDAADKTADISSKWTKSSLAKVAPVASVKDDPADYGKALSEFASAQAELTAESLAAFADVAKKVQMETVELMLAAGKDMTEDMTAAAKKATAEVTSAAKKATAAK